MVSFVIFNKKYTMQELVVQFVAQAVLIAIVFGVVYSLNGPGRTVSQVLNGEVTKKAREVVPCRHSYACNCHQVCSGSGDDRTCHTECDTCYTHDSHSTWQGTDIVWAVYSNIGTRIEINTLDSKGTQEPPRWTQVVIGEPYSKIGSYENLLKGNSDSLFVKKGFIDKYKGFSPAYPIVIYDYYRINRIISEVNIPNSSEWEKQLSVINSKLGPNKQCNVVLVFMNNRSPEYFYALKEHWDGANKNDVVIVSSIKDNVIMWAEVMSLSRNAMIGVTIRDEMIGKNISTVRPEEFMAIVSENVLKNYKRRSMKEFEYLKLNNVMSGTQMMWICLFSIVLSVGLSVFFVNTEDGKQFY